MSCLCRAVRDQGAEVGALPEAVREGKLSREKLLCLVVYGSGFTWGRALVKW